MSYLHQSTRKAENVLDVPSCEIAHKYNTVSPAGLP
jgi:hypothetical protein